MRLMSTSQLVDLLMSNSTNPVVSDDHQRLYREAALRLEKLDCEVDRLRKAVDFSERSYWNDER